MRTQHPWRIPSLPPAIPSTVRDVDPAARDLLLAQRFARHASPLTTIIYTHPADEELYEGIRDLPC